MILAYASTPYRGGMRLPLRYAGSWSDSSKPEPGVMRSSWSGRRTVPCISAWTLGTSTCIRRKTCTPCLGFRRPWKVWWGWCTSHQWTSNQAFGRSRWPQDHNSTWPSRWGTLGSTSLPACHLGCATHWRHSRVSCRTPWGS